MLGTFTKPRWLTGGLPLAGRWSVTTRALEVCWCVRNLIALCSAVSASVSSAFLINEDYIQRVLVTQIKKEKNKTIYCALETANDAEEDQPSNQKVNYANIVQIIINQMQSCLNTCRSGNLGISAKTSIKAAPFLLNSKYSTARCCISASMQLSYLGYMCSSID